jgi:dethiobiotin synthetase
VVTILVSGSGTGVGKTRVTAALAHTARQHGRTVQIIKPVQTGVILPEPSDAEIVAQLAGLAPDCVYTLRRYRAPLSPLAAVAAENAQLDIKEIIREIFNLPPVDIRLIEGAGGAAVPLGPNGWDWMEFADEIHAHAVILVVPDELGAINQSRLVYDYARSKYRDRPPCGVLLNALTPPPPDVAASTREALQACGVPLCGELAAGALDPVLHCPALIEWLTK